MRVVALRLCPAHKHIQQRNSLLLVAGRGIDGDCHQGGQRQVSLLSYAAEQRMDEMGRPGLCMKKFAANIVVDGLWRLQPGDGIRAGEALLDVTQTGKRCYTEECDYANTKHPCPLQGCVYAAVRLGGSVSVGDEVRVETESTLR